ncbi:MAG: hypothetical protein QNK83_06580 [Akkermansiaceae bacterium]
MKRNFHCPPYLLAALAGLPFSLSAQIVWDGSTSTDFEDGTNWVGDTAPANDTTTDIAQLTGGTVDITADRSVASLDLATAGTTLSGTGTTLTLGGGLNGSQDLTLSGSVTLAAHGVSSSYGYTGDIFIGSGTTLTAQRNSIRLVDNTVKTLITLDGGTLAEDGDHMDLTGRDIVLNAGGGTLRHVHARNIFGDYVVSGAGHLTMEGAGSTVGRVQLTQVNTYTGGSTVTNGGQAWIYNDNSLGADNTSVALDTGGTLHMVSNRNLQSRAISVNAGGGRISMNGKAISIGGTLSGAGSLDIFGGGRIEMNSNGNTLTGPVSIDATEVRLSGGTGTDHLGTGSITLDNGAKLKNRNNNNSVTIGNNIVLASGGGTFEAGWNRNILVTGDISGSGLLTVGNDGSSINMNSAVNTNTYSGGTEIKGFVNVKGTNVFGTGAITLNDENGSRGQLQNWNGGGGSNAVLTLDNDLVIHANGGRIKAGWDDNVEITGVASGTGQLTIEEDSGVVVLSNTGNTFNGPIVLPGTNSRLKVGSLGSGSYTGTISGDGTVEFAGSGTQTIASSSTITYTGSTVVDGTNGGTLNVNADMSSTPIFVRANATVSGIGTLGITVIEAGGSIAPGNSPGTISTSDFTLAATATYAAEIDGLAAHDLIAVTGAVNLDAAAVLDLTFTGTGYLHGDIIMLIDNDEADAINGTFAGLNEGDTAITHDGLDWTASYLGGDGNDFILAAVPEPSVSLLGALGALALLRRRRRA